MITARAAAILSAATVAAVGLYLYFTPYQQCVRDLAGEMTQPTNAGPNDCEVMGINCPELRYKNPAADCLARMSSR